MILGPTILLTGLPRSGTTLTCALLNDFDDTLALPEPIQLERHGDRARAIYEIDHFVTEARRNALESGIAITKHVDGKIRDNFVDEPTGEPGLRRPRAGHGVVNVAKPLSPDFRLIVKHPAEFTALADLLIGRYPLVALVRHPLAVLAAWQTVDMPVNRGHMPMAEAFSPELAELLAAIPDNLARQVALMGWLLRTYARFPADAIMRYEDLVSQPRQVLARFSPNAIDPARLLVAVDPAVRYIGVDFSRLARALLSIEAEAEVFYPNFAASLARWLVA
jgi:hypothetical protein